MQTLPPIITPNFIICGSAGAGSYKYKYKNKMFCFDGVCQTVAQVAAILYTTTTTAAITPPGEVGGSEVI